MAKRLGVALSLLLAGLLQPPPPPLLGAGGAPSALVSANVTVKAALPDRAVGRSDGIVVKVYAQTPAGEEKILQAPLARKGRQELKGDFKVLAGKPLRLRVEVSPGASAAGDELGIDSIVVTAAGQSRELIATAREAFGASRGNRTPHHVEYRHGRYEVGGEQTAGMLLSGQRYTYSGAPLGAAGGDLYDSNVVFDCPPFHPGKHNYARDAVVRASSAMQDGRNLRAVVDGALGRRRWQDGTPQDFPDWVELHFLYPEPVVVEHVNLVTYGSFLPGDRVRDFDILGLEQGRWVTLYSARDHDGVVATAQLPRPRTLQALRVVSLAAGIGDTGVVEVEAWGPQTARARIQSAGSLRVTLDGAPEASDGRSRKRPHFSRGEIPGLNMEVTSPLAGRAPFTVTTRLTTRGGDPVKTWERARTLAPGEPWNDRIDPGPLPGGMYLYDVVLRRGERTLASASAEFGVESAPTDLRSARVDLSGVTPFDVGKGSWSIPAWTAPGHGIGNAVLQQAREANCDTLCTMLSLSHIAPYLHTYDFGAITQSVERARKAGIGLELVLSMTWFTLPPWLDVPQDRILDSEGRNVPIKNTQGNTPSYWSPFYLREWEQVVGEIVTRFGESDAVKMWHFRVGNADTFYHDVWEEKRVFDYSPHALREFIRYLRDVRKYTLEEVNRRYGLKLTAWEQLKLPYPAYRTEYDLRPYWADFIDFKQHTIDHLLERTFSTVRRFDSKRPQTFWGVGGSGALDFVIRKCAEHDVLLGFNSIDSPMSDVFADLARRQGVGLRAELTARPLDATRFHRALFGALANGALLYNLSAVPEKQVWDQFVSAGGLFHELCGARPWSSDVAALFSYTYARQKSFQWTTWKGLKAVPAAVDQLLSVAQTGAVEIDWFSDYSDLRSLRGHRIIVEPGSPVLPRRAIDALVDYVRSGGTLVLFPESGRFEDANPGSEYPLLRRLGGKAGASWPEGMPPNARAGAKAAGRSAAATWKHGRGTVVRVGEPFAGAEPLRRFLDGLLEQHRIVRPVVAPDGILAAPIEKAGRRYVLFYNTSAQKKTSAVRIHAGNARAARLRVWAEGRWRDLGKAVPEAGYFTLTLPQRGHHLAAVEIGDAAGRSPLGTPPLGLQGARGHRLP